MRHLGISVAVWSLALLVGCGSDEPPVHRDAAALSAALSTARPGDTVRVGAARIAGSFTVPPGVTLVGEGPSRTILESGPDGRAVLIIEGEAGFTSTVQQVGVVSTGTAGVIARGTGEVRVEATTIETSRGIAFGAQDLRTLRLGNVQVSGPVTDLNAGMILDPAPDTHATHGIVLVRVTDAQITDTTASGFASFGALLIDSTTIWTGGAASGNRAVGIMAYRGRAEMRNLEVCQTFETSGLIPPYGTVFAEGVEVVTDGLVVCEVAGFGVFHSNAGGTHSNIEIADNNSAGLWVQYATGLNINGAGTSIRNNSLGGIVAVRTSNMTVDGGEITTTNLMTRVVGETGTARVGDGVHLVESTDGINIANVRLDLNMRAGVLADLNGGSTAGITLSNVTANSDDSLSEGDPTYGVVAQNGTVDPAWDATVMRMGSAATNDPLFLSGSLRLNILGVVAPTDIPAAEIVSMGGLGALGVVAPTD